MVRGNVWSRIKMKAKRTYDPEVDKARHAKWYAANKEAVNARHAAYRANNKKKEKVRHAKQYVRYNGINRLWRQQNPEKQKIIMRRRALKKFGLTIEQYEAMSAAQDHKCAICGKPENGKRRLAVDHCHETGLIRALLCGPCNNHLGTYELHRHKFETYLIKYGAGS